MLKQQSISQNPLFCYNYFIAVKVRYKDEASFFIIIDIYIYIQNYINYMLLSLVFRQI